MTPEERAFLRALAAWYGDGKVPPRDPCAVANTATALNNAGALSVSGQAPPKEAHATFGCVCSAGVPDLPGAHGDEVPDRSVRAAPPPEKGPRPDPDYQPGGAKYRAAAPPKEPPAPSLASEANSPNIGINAPSLETRSVEGTIEKMAREMSVFVNDLHAHSIRESKGYVDTDDLARWAASAMEALRLYREEKEASASRCERLNNIAHDADRQAAALRAERDEARKRIERALTLLATRGMSGGYAHMREPGIAALRGGKVERD